jgi:hypothetical protein
MTAIASGACRRGSTGGINSREYLTSADRMASEGAPKIGTFEYGGRPLEVWRGDQLWHVTFAGLAAENRRLDEALEEALGKTPLAPERRRRVELMVQVLSWAQPD